ncbi:MAG: tetratricopeptide repeat protein [Deltaproteobacteria bacterium]|nr:tetratricopeptide repeat protein [Deltaproteobacteria bacterium]
MATEPEVWTTQGLLAHFLQINEKMEDRSFTFILGSGASRPSGIPTGGELVRTWLAELHQRLDPQFGKQSIKAWATAENLDIPEFDYAQAETFYPQVFERRFGADPEEGYTQLESIMAEKEPSFGYSVLAQVLAKTRHRVVVTTNFDNLVADALSIYSQTYPLVCGHESLAGFVRAQMRRPLVAKIHRDLLLAPKNDQDGTASLPESWAQALEVLFRHHTPLVIGYGGNDGSLMGFLEALAPGAIKGRLLWCYREHDGQPNTRICNVVVRHRGALIPIAGFDEFMLQLGNELRFGLLDQELEQQVKERAERYRKSVEALQQRLSPPDKEGTTALVPTEVQQALAATIERESSWWAWALKAREEPDQEKCEQIYRQGLTQFPESPELLSNFANFMTDIPKNYDEAERLYRRALDLEPNSADIIGNLAVFMHEVRKNHDEAERLYRRALDLEPNHANVIGNFAEFLLARGRSTETREFVKRAWRLNGASPTTLAASLSLDLALLARTEQQDDASALGRLKTLLTTGFEPGDWSFDDVLAATAPKLSEEDRAFYAALATAILDKAKVVALEAFPRWKDIVPIPLETPWGEG